MTTLDPHMDRICSNCGLTFGAHRGGSVIPDQCPEHEGRMDWPDAGGTIFYDSGTVCAVAVGTPAYLLRAPYEKRRIANEQAQQHRRNAVASVLIRHFSVEPDDATLDEVITAADTGI